MSLLLSFDGIRRSVFSVVTRASRGSVAEIMCEPIHFAHGDRIGVRIGRQWTYVDVHPSVIMRAIDVPTTWIDAWVRLAEMAVRRNQPALLFAVVCMDCKKATGKLIAVPGSTGLCDPCFNARMRD